MKLAYSEILPSETAARRAVWRQHLAERDRWIAAHRERIEAKRRESGQRAGDLG